MLVFLQNNIPYLLLGIASLLLLLISFAIGMSVLMRRTVGLQRLQSSNFKNMLNACRYLIELNRKVDQLELETGKKVTVNPNRLFRSDSAYQYAAQLFQTGRDIDEVVESTQLSWGEAELIQALHSGK